MIESKITTKNQTTVPRTVRERLGVGPSDVLHWEVQDGYARVAPASRGFRKWRGAIAVGPGSTVEDVRQARRIRGSEGA